MAERWGAVRRPLRLEVIMGGKSSARDVGTSNSPSATRRSGSKVQIRISRKNRQVLDAMGSARGDKDTDATLSYLLSLAPETPTIMEMIRRVAKDRGDAGGK